MQPAFDAAGLRDGQFLAPPLFENTGPPLVLEQRRSQKLAPSGLSAAALILPAPDWTARRGVASGIGLSSAARALSATADPGAVASPERAKGEERKGAIS